MRRCTRQLTLADCSDLGDVPVAEPVVVLTANIADLYDCPLGIVLAAGDPNLVHAGFEAGRALARPQVEVVLVPGADDDGVLDLLFLLEVDLAIAISVSVGIAPVVGAAGLDLAHRRRLERSSEMGALGDHSIPAALWRTGMLPILRVCEVEQ